MKSLWIAVATGAALLMAPAWAQHAPAKEDPVKVGVEAYERGDYKTAVDLWRSAAIKGNADAQFNLGQAYKMGRGVPTDLKQAEEWYRKAAAQGHEEGEANYGLALFENGKRAEAAPWLERGVARGNPRTQYVLGIMLFNADGVAKDWVRAYALMVRASSTGLEAATKALAQMDQYISVKDRQDGLALARKYEADYNRGAVPAAPVAVASAKPKSTPAPPHTKAAAPATTAPAPARDGGWRVQLGAFGDPANARKLWGQVGGRFPGRQPYYVKSGSLTRLLVGPFGSKAEAAKACGGVNPCVPVAK
ncbi:SPOR domain-containing protein [Sphingomonas sp. JC676]|uniref:SPOR domain-containing protein n=1 Tax=Sphingomonas sp. JC676 TaxID=2768065 RepID=UPI0016576FFE|nr:SPOR domain-containing protein [Sphingomonas sp. JC676]MBC9031099.1 SPOR domain-containing protein [Sphingomonas sp. JC676]